MAEGVAVDDELLLETGMEFDEMGETAPTEDKTAEEVAAPQIIAEDSEGVQVEAEDPEAEMRRAVINLYRSLNIAPENAEDDGWRLNALHLFGTHDLSTEDIMAYFQAFSPSTVEWIDDASCNVVWTDSEGPARALLELTTEIENEVTADKQKPSVTVAATEMAKLTGESFDTTSAAITLTEGDVELHASEGNDSKMLASTDLPDSVNNVPTFVADSGLQIETVGAANDDRAVATSVENQKQLDEEEEQGYVVEEPPMNFLWRRTRRGVPNRSSDRFLLFVRFACDEDRKRRGAHLRSQFYLKYGNPHFDGIRSLVSRSLRRKLTAKQSRRIELDEKLERLRADLRRQKSSASCEDAVFDYEPAVRERESTAESAFRGSAKDDLDAVGDDSGAAHVWAAVAEQLGENDTAESRPRDIPSQLRTAQGARRWQGDAHPGASTGPVDFDALLKTFRANQIVRKARERQRSSYGASDSGFTKFDDVEEGELPDGEEGDGEQEAPASSRHERGRGEKRMRMHADIETDKVRDSDRHRSVRRSTEFDPEVGRLSVSVSLAGRNRTRAFDLDDSSRRRDVDSEHRVRVNVVRDARNRLGKRKVSLEDGEYENDDEELEEAPRAQKDLRDVLRSRRTANATHRLGGSKKVDY